MAEEQNSVPETPAEEKPRRRGRKPKAVAAAEAGAVEVASASDAFVSEEKPRRARRTRKAGDVAPASTRSKKAPSSDAALSDEVVQARALAQISQASVVRRQRRAAERAAEALATSAKPLPSASAPSPAVDAAAPVPSHAEPAAAPAEAAGQMTIPLVDPALRPHRRGRKPKAYVEAERAAAAALAAQEAFATSAHAEPAQAPERNAAPVDVHADAAPAVEASEASSGDAEDKRPGRARRAAEGEGKAKGKGGKKASERKHAAEAPAEDAAASSASDADKQAQDHDAQAAAPADAEAQNAAAPAPSEHGSRRTHASRRERQAQDRGQNHDRGNDRANDRRNRQKDRKQRGNSRYNAPTEPSLSREELAAMKVAELREKARELDIDPTGKKKAELVEAVYTAAARAEGFRDIEGILDISNDGFGYIRAHGYMPSRDDAFVPANLIRAARLRPGDYIVGTLRPSRQGDKYPGLAKIQSINGRDPEEMRTRPKFSDLTPIYPNERLKMEHGKDSITGRAIDIVAPVGKGQRGLIVSPPKAGKTTVLKHICQSIAINNPEVHLICLLVDERPEEVTDMQRSIKGEVVASTFDMPADNHTRVSELVIERAKRLVELGEDVVVVLDSITRLARAYNLAAPASGRILSGGVDSAALYPPKRFLGAARNIENGGSLTILASALIETGSKMDEVIFEEFKGTGNMELKLDRDLADRRIFPAIDPVASGTRNEDLLIDEQMRPFTWGIRRILANMNNTERCASSFIKGLKGTNSNEEFLIRSAKRAAEHGDLLK
ncbi:MAG TPA: transcription termination factor Rho [Candidatus Limicola stercorigallinarum]|nr:transcription termination factor Rho [Candidatus Limicola stercorigallinarum]